MNERTQSILDEIARPGSTQASIAAFYREGIRASLGDHRFVDWPTVNAALLKRYKPSGLNRIKALAWKS